MAVAVEPRPSSTLEGAGVTLAELLAVAQTPVDQDERQRVDHAAHVITVLALLDVLEHPDDETPTAPPARTLAAGVSADVIEALVETIPPRQAHNFIEALTVHGRIDSDTARVAHLRVDLKLSGGLGDD
jgi:ATP-dependent exoDNAse (exonuclease V) beta subunit